MDSVLLGGLLGLAGVVVGFVLQEVSAQLRHRGAARNTLHALWLEIVEADVLLNTYLTHGVLPAPEQVDLSFPTLKNRADDLRAGLGHHGLNYCARVLGSGNRRLGATLQFVSQAAFSRKEIPDETREQATETAKIFQTEINRAGRYIDAKMKLTLWMWLRHPRRALRARQTVRSAERAQTEFEERPRLPTH